MNKIRLIFAAVMCFVTMTAVAQKSYEEMVNTSGAKTGSDLNFSGNSVQSTSATAMSLGNNLYYGDVVVPEKNGSTPITTLKTRTVPLLGTVINGAFQYSYITSCVLPKTITSIEQGAFSDCPYLLNIYVDDANTKYMDIDGVVYEHNGDWVPHTLVFVPGGKTSVNIDSRVAKIADCAFDGCTNIKEVTIPASVTEIGQYAFAQCNLTTMIVLAPTPPKVNGGEWSSRFGLANLTVDAVLVPAASEKTYEGNQYWDVFSYEEIQPFNPVVEEKSFTLTAEVTETYANNKYTQIKTIRVSGSNGEVFVALPEGWTLTDAQGNSYAMTCQLNENKAVVVSVNPVITTDGVYTLTVPAGSLTTEDGKCEAKSFSWAVNAPKVVHDADKYEAVTLKMADADASFLLSYVRDGEVVSVGAEHTVGSILYTRVESYKDGNDTHIVNHIYYSANAEYTRVFKNNKWQALYVPFDLVYNASWGGSYEIAEIVSVTESVREGDVVWFYVTVEPLGNGEIIKANTPCVIRSQQADGATVTRTITLATGNTVTEVDGVVKREIGSAGNTYSFMGQYTQSWLKNEEGKKVFAMSGGAICPPSSTAANGVKLGAYRWFLEIHPSVSNRTAVFSFGNFGDGEEGTMAIENVHVEIIEKDVYYDLSGRRVENPVKGVYIKNGKKVYVK